MPQVFLRKGKSQEAIVGNLYPWYAGLNPACGIVSTDLLRQHAALQLHPLSSNRIMPEFGYAAAECASG
jgi:hypothetical protein